MSPYQEGYQAYMYAINIEDCHYDFGTDEYNSWHSGYNDASFDD